MVLENGAAGPTNLWRTKARGPSRSRELMHMPKIWPRGEIFTFLVARSSIAAPKANKASSPHQRASIGIPSPHQGGQLAPQQPKGGGGQGGACAGPPTRHLARARPAQPQPPCNPKAGRRQGVCVRRIRSNADARHRKRSLMGIAGRQSLPTPPPAGPGRSPIPPAI